LPRKFKDLFVSLIAYIYLFIDYTLEKQERPADILEKAAHILELCSLMQKADTTRSGYDREKPV
jgi:hypothetical protein